MQQKSSFKSISTNSCDLTISKMRLLSLFLALYAVADATSSSPLISPPAFVKTQRVAEGKILINKLRLVAFSLV